MRYRITALAATSHCLDVYHRPHRKPGPLPPPPQVLHPVELTIGMMLSAPLFPAQVDPSPHPLWLGLMLLPPKADHSPALRTPLGLDGKPKRMAMRDYMARVSKQIGLQLGDAADELRHTILAQVQRRHRVIQPPTLPEGGTAS